MFEDFVAELYLEAKFRIEIHKGKYKKQEAEHASYICQGFIYFCERPCDVESFTRFPQVDLGILAIASH